MDHHTAARHFMRHIGREGRARRAITGLSHWLVPPMSGSTTPAFHRGSKDTALKPNVFYQEDPWVELMPNRSPADVSDGIARPHGPGER